MKRPANCWEYKKCGREPGGANAAELGVCPSAVEARVDGVNRGSNAGRACWMVTGTYCRGQVQGTYARKFKDCMQCEFYRSVIMDEERAFQSGSAVLRLLDNPPG